MERCLGFQTRRPKEKANLRGIRISTDFGLDIPAVKIPVD
jgi:hypothetical protein